MSEHFEQIFVESDNHLEYWKTISLIFHAFQNIIVTYTFLSLSCIVNISSITFLSLDNQQDNKSKPLCIVSSDSMV